MRISNIRKPLPRGFDQCVSFIVDPVASAGARAGGALTQGITRLARRTAKPAVSVAGSQGSLHCTSLPYLNGNNLVATRLSLPLDSKGDGAPLTVEGLRPSRRVTRTAPSSLRIQHRCDSVGLRKCIDFFLHSDSCRDGCGYFRVGPKVRMWLPVHGAHQRYAS